VKDGRSAKVLFGIVEVSREAPGLRVFWSVNFDSGNGKSRGAKIGDARSCRLLSMEERLEGENDFTTKIMSQEGKRLSPRRCGDA
jgi:hypothetical protein